MTANGPIQLPVAPSAASAAVGNARTAKPLRISERRTTPSSMRVIRLVVLGMMLGLFDRSRDVEHRQHHEDERLQKRHQDFQGVEEPDEEDDGHHAAEPSDEAAG